MRILIVTEWSPWIGGTERYVELLRDGLRSAGDEVRLLTSSAGSAANGTADHVCFGTTHRSLKAGLQLFNPSAHVTIRSIVREFRPDAVHVNAFLPQLSPSLLWPLREIPTELLVSDYVPICPVGTKLLPDGTTCTDPRGRVCRERGCIGRARSVRDAGRYAHLRSGLAACVNHVSAASGALRRALAGDGIAAEVMSPPIRPPSPSFTRRPDGDPHFVYAGRLAPVKGVDVLLRAFARLAARERRARMTISGDGEQRHDLTTLAERLGLAGRVTFHMSMDRDWQRVLEPAWALVVPSVYPEPLGVVAIEGIAHGVPVIASDTGGLAESVRPGRTGLLVPPADEDALLAAMESIAAGKAHANHGVDPTAAKDLIDRHDLARHVASVRGLLRGLAETGAPA